MVADAVMLVCSVLIGILNFQCLIVHVRTHKCTHVCMYEDAQAPLFIHMYILYVHRHACLITIHLYIYIVLLHVNSYERRDMNIFDKIIQC